jgi:epoxyqueuosine reductase
MPINLHKNSHIVKSIAEQLGFDQCGIAKAERLDEDARRLEKWLNKGFHGEMTYMENHFDMRVDPTKLVPGAKSVITLLCNYFPKENQLEGSPRVAKYAFGKDYHEVIREKLHAFLFLLRESFGEIQGRGFVDSAPVLERSWAERSGLGWIGKNGNIINTKKGSFFFIATLITDIELESTTPLKQDYCGTCNKCVEACPTDAILPGKTLDASKCISYITIEMKSKVVSDGLKDKIADWIFGCDICQDVCPWNRFSKPTTEKNFDAIEEVLSFSFEDWKSLNKETFNSIFKESAIKRSKWEGMMRNIAYHSKNLLKEKEN